VSGYEDLVTQLDDAVVFTELLEEDPENQELETELSSLLNTVGKQLDELEIKSLLSGKYDNDPCFFYLNSGAGGTDAQDWTQMLYRMYTRWFEQKGFQYELIDQTLGDEAGLKSATLYIKGDFAYGYAKNEIGVHRLVRLSPFNANNKRQTSFAAVEVVPEINFDEYDLEIDSKDLKIDTYRASGAGGQHVNKTDSAVRITHLPTGIVVQCQNSRSQGANKDTAMKMLKSRLLKVMEEQHKEQINEIRGKSVEIAWGNQIRSYVFHPYKLVKDLRSNTESTDVSAVMDGEIDDFINANLRL